MDNFTVGRIRLSAPDPLIKWPWCVVLLHLVKYTASPIRSLEKKKKTNLNLSKLILELSSSLGGIL